MTALIGSSLYGHFEVVKTLLESGASVNEKDGVSFHWSLRIMYILRNYCRVVLFGCRSHYPLAFEREGTKRNTISILVD